MGFKSVIICFFFIKEACMSLQGQILKTIISPLFQKLLRIARFLLVWIQMRGAKLNKALCCSDGDKEGSDSFGRSSIISAFSPVLVSCDSDLYQNKMKNWQKFEKKKNQARSFLVVLCIKLWSWYTTKK